MSNYQPDIYELLQSSASSAAASKPLFEDIDTHPTITVSQFKEGDQVRFTRTGYGHCSFTVIYVDSKFAYLRAPYDDTSEYRASLRSSELRQFDKMGWTLLEGKFDYHISASNFI